MQSPDRPGPGSPMSRRALLAGGSAALLLATAGCNPFSTTRSTKTVTATAPPPIDPMDTLIAMTRLHLLRLEAALSLGGKKVRRLQSLRDDRAAHLQWLVQEQARVNRTDPAPVTEPGQAVPAPASAEAAIAEAADDAASAQLAFSDQLGNVSPYRAAMFASISACLASHRVVLT